MLNNKGFSLIEIMITIAMIAILTAIATPGLRTWMNSHRVSSSALSLSSALQTAKAAAVTNQANVAIRFITGTGTGGSYLVFIDDGANRGTYDAGERIIKRGGMEKNVTLYQANFQGGWNTVTQFNSMGLASGFGGNVRVRNDSNTLFKRVVLTDAGNVRIEKSATGADGSWTE